MPRKTAQPQGPQAIVKPVRHHTGPLTSANIAGYECWSVPDTTVDDVDTGSQATPHRLMGPRFDRTRHGGLYTLYTDALADMQDMGYVPVPQFSGTRALVRF